MTAADPDCMVAESVERIRLPGPNGRSFTLRTATPANGTPAVMRATSGKGSAMVECAREVVTGHPKEARAKLLATLAALPAPEIPESRCEVAPVLTFAESIEFARDCLQRAEAIEAEARELRDEARRVVQRAMS